MKSNGRFTQNFGHAPPQVAALGIVTAYLDLLKQITDGQQADSKGGDGAKTIQEQATALGKRVETVRSVLAKAKIPDGKDAEFKKGEGALSAIGNVIDDIQHMNEDAITAQKLADTVLHPKTPVDIDAALSKLKEFSADEAIYGSTMVRYDAFMKNVLLASDWGKGTPAERYNMLQERMTADPKVSAPIFNRNVGALMDAAIDSHKKLIELMTHPTTPERKEAAKQAFDRFKSFATDLAGAVNAIKG